jgi:cytochrome c oxidase subunit IV
MKQATTMKDMQSHIISYRTYLYVWAALLTLLGLTIAVAEIHFSKYGVLINLLIASIKAALVLMFFMHLKYEGRFLKGLLLLSLSALTLIIALTFADVWYR